MRWLALLLLVGAAHAQDLDAILDAALAERRSSDTITLEGARIEGLEVIERGLCTVDAIGIGPWRIEGPLRIEASGRGAARTLELSGDLAVWWAGLDLGHGIAALRRAEGDWIGRWRSDEGIARVDAEWRAADVEGPPVVIRVADLFLGALAARWLRDTPLAALTGRATLEITVEDSPDGLVGALSIAASPVLRGKPIGEVLVDARRVPGAAPALQLAVRGPIGIIEARARFPSTPDAPFTYSPTAPLELEATLQSIELAKLSEIWPILALAGRTYGRITLDGTARRPRLNSSLLTAGMAWRGEAIGRFVVGLAYYDGQFVPSINWDGHSTLNGRFPGQLDLDARDARWDHTEPLALTVRAQGLTPKRLRPFWKAHPAADFTLDLTLDANDALRDLALRGALTGVLRRRGHPQTPFSARLLGTSRTQTVEARIGADVFVGDWRLRAPLLAIREGTARWGETRIEGGARARLPLAMLAPYLPRGAFDPRGEITGQVATTGTLAVPRFNGAVALREGAITLVDLAQRLVDIEAKGSITDGTLTLEAVTAQSGIGTLSGQGSLSLRATPEDAPADLPLWSAWRLGIAVQLRADRFPFIHDTLPNGTFDTDLTLDALLRPRDTRARIALRASQVHLTGVRMPNAQAIPHHRGVRTLDWAGAIRVEPSVFAGDGTLAITAVLDEPIHVDGEGVDLELTGALTIERDGDEARTEGGFVAAPGGRFDLFGNRFEVIGGGMRMEGGDLKAVVEIEAGHAMLQDPDQPIAARPLEPIIELRAQGQVIDTTIEVAVIGPGRRPELILSSDPPLPEYRILTLLITGRVDAVDERNGDVRRQVAQLVSRFHNPSLARQLYDRLGVDKLGLKFGSSVTNPILTVGKQISRQLYLETVYHHDAPADENEKEVHVEYRLNPRWTLDTVYGDAAKGSVGVFWKTSFGRARRPGARRSERAAQPEVERHRPLREGDVVPE